MSEWPEISMNFRPVSGGVECTMRTTYKEVILSVSETGVDTAQAESRARRALSRKVADRKSFE